MSGARPRFQRARRYDSVQSAGLKHATAVGAGYLAAASLLYESGDQRAILHGIRTGNPQLILDSFDWSRWKNKLADGTRSPIIRAFNDGAVAAETGTHLIIQKQYADLRGTFNAKLPQAEVAASLTAALAVTRVDHETMMALRDVIVRAFRYNISVAEQAVEIERILRATAGLDRRRARALQRFEQELRDRGMGGDLLAARVRMYRDRLLHDRALTIARHETLSAISQGQEETWRQAVQSGALPATMNEIWLTAHDDRRCEICKGLDNQIVPRGHSFISKANGRAYERPPVHVQCRCSRGLTTEPPTEQVEGPTGQDLGRSQ